MGFWDTFLRVGSRAPSPTGQFVRKGLELGESGVGALGGAIGTGVGTAVRPATWLAGKAMGGGGSTLGWLAGHGWQMAAAAPGMTALTLATLPLMMGGEGGPNIHKQQAQQATSYWTGQMGQPAPTGGMPVYASAGFRADEVRQMMKIASVAQRSSGVDLEKIAANPKALLGEAGKLLQREVSEAGWSEAASKIFSDLQGAIARRRAHFAVQIPKIEETLDRAVAANDQAAIDAATRRRATLAAWRDALQPYQEFNNAFGQLVKARELQGAAALERAEHSTALTNQRIDATNALRRVQEQNEELAKELAAQKRFSRLSSATASLSSTQREVALQESVRESRMKIRQLERDLTEKTELQRRENLLGREKDARTLQSLDRQVADLRDQLGREQERVRTLQADLHTAEAASKQVARTHAEQAASRDLLHERQIADLREKQEAALEKAKGEPISRWLGRAGIFAGASLGFGAGATAVGIGASRMVEKGRQLNETKGFNAMVKVDPALKSEKNAPALFRVLNRASPYVAGEPILAAAAVRSMLETPSPVEGVPYVTPRMMSDIMGAEAARQSTRDTFLAQKIPYVKLPGLD